jgi:L-ascorbate metabolism protein UlaG (beta-lactamase superfamily)
MTEADARRRQLLKASSAALIAAPFLRPTAGFAQTGGYSLSDDPTLTTLVQTSAGGPAPASPDTLTIRWLGCANHELAFGDKVVLLDAWYDRGPHNRPLGFAPQDVTRADLIINGHAHFDHIADIAAVARQTGAAVMGAPISTEYLRSQGLPDSQLLPTAGGEHFDFDGYSVDAILAHHSQLPTEVLSKLGDALAADAPPLTPAEQQQAAEIRARGLMDPRIITEGTIAYLFTFDNGFRLVYRNSAGPITDSERAAMAQVEGTDLAIIAYQGHVVADSQIAVTLPLVQLYNPSIYLPTHHDTAAGFFIDQATEPLFMAIRDSVPSVRSVSPLYRTPVAVSMERKQLLLGA